MIEHSPAPYLLLLHAEDFTLNRDSQAFWPCCLLETRIKMNAVKDASSPTKGHVPACSAWHCSVRKLTFPHLFFYTRYLTQGWKLPPDATASSRLSWYWRSSPDHKFNSKELPLLEKPPRRSEISSDRCSEQKSSLLAITAPWIRSAVRLEESELCLVMCNRFTEEFRIPSFQESSSATNGCVCSRMSSAWTIASLKIMRTVLPRKRSHSQYLPACFISCFHVLITSETWILN